MSHNLFIETLQTPIGCMKIAADDAAIVEITFLNEDAPQIYPNRITQQAKTQLEEYFKGLRRLFDLPLAASGTDFQRMTWEKLQSIEYGTTISYAEFSKDQPLAIRAMAAANGKNKLLIVVPCHRVIGSNGKLVGFASGLERKRWLLDFEQRIAQKGQTKMLF